MIAGHWEKNAMENELMTSSKGNHREIITNFTLHMLEDSGWYKVNYEYAEPAYWGKNRGCDFSKTCDGNIYPEFLTSYGTYCNY